MIGQVNFVDYSIMFRYYIDGHLEILGDCRIHNSVQNRADPEYPG